MSNDLRSEQIAEGKRRTLSVRPSFDKPNGGGGARPGYDRPKRPFVAKGHDAILKEVQDNGGYLAVTLMSDGSTVSGQLVARDKFTITVLTEEGRRRTFYKHAIESFEPVQVQ